MRDQGEDTATNTDLGSIRIDASVIEYKRLIEGDKAWPDRRWAIENADGLGHHLNLRLLTAGEVVLYIATTETARVRKLSRGGRRKNERIDAAAAASGTVQQGRRQAGLSNAVSGALTLLDEQRVKLSCKRTRVISAMQRS